MADSTVSTSQASSIVQLGSQSQYPGTSHDLIKIKDKGSKGSAGITYLPAMQKKYAATTYYLSYLNLLNPQSSNLSHQLKQIHAQLITNALSSSPTTRAKLIQHYSSQSPTHQYAHSLLYHHQKYPNFLFLFNTFLRCTTPLHSMLTFSNWVTKNEVNFDEFTYRFMVGACARMPKRLFWEGKQLHCLVLKNGFLSSLILGTTLVHFYGENWDVGCARKLFDEMSVRSCASWNVMIKGYCSGGRGVEGGAKDGLGLFRDMVRGGCGVRPNCVTMVSVLSGVAALGVVESGVCVHGYIEKTVSRAESDVFIGTGLVDMYSKCGCVEDALLVFHRMREKNVLTWTAMATGLALNGRGKEALELLDAMDLCGVKPNAVTFTSLLSACCHAALVEEGLHLFNAMGRKFGVTPRIQHYGCIVDLLGKAGLLREAYEFILGMPIDADAILWRSLLGACRVHGDVMMGEKVGKVLLYLESKHDSLGVTATSEDYVALSNVYASAGRWERVEMIRCEMKVKGVKLKPGSSFNINHGSIIGLLHSCSAKTV